MQPFVSFLIPAFNEEKHIADTIQNILAQTDKDFELIICDDGSTDRTWEILLQNQIPDKIFIYRNEKNLGLYQTRDVLIGKSRGRYIVFVDADDKISEKYVAEIKQIVKKSDYDIIHFPLKVTPVKGAKSHSFFSNNLILKDHERLYGKDILNTFLTDSVMNNWWHIAAKVFRGDWIRSLDLKESEHIINGEDFLRYIKLLFFAESFIYINREMYFYCVGNGGNGKKKISVDFFCKKIHDSMAVYRKSRSFLINNGTDESIVNKKMDSWIRNFQLQYLDLLNQGDIAADGLDTAIDFFSKECGTGFMHDVIRYKWLHELTPISIAFQNFRFFFKIVLQRWKTRLQRLCSGQRNWFN